MYSCHCFSSLLLLCLAGLSWLEPPHQHLLPHSTGQHLEARDRVLIMLREDRGKDRLRDRFQSLGGLQKLHFRGSLHARCFPPMLPLSTSLSALFLPSVAPSLAEDSDNLAACWVGRMVCTHGSRIYLPPAGSSQRCQWTCWVKICVHLR